MRRHKINIALFLMYAICAQVYAQSKIYIAGGVSNVFGSSTNIILGDESYGIRFAYPTIDIEYQRRLIGSFNVVAGISLFTAGYQASDNTFSSASEFNSTYVSLPLMG